MPSSGKGAATWSLSLMAGLLNWGEACSGQIMKVLVFRWSPINNKWDWILLTRMALVWQGSDSEAGKNFSHSKSQLLSAFTCSLAYWLHISGDWAEVFSRAPQLEGWALSWKWVQLQNSLKVSFMWWKRSQMPLECPTVPNLFSILTSTFSYNNNSSNWLWICQWVNTILRTLNILFHLNLIIIL